MTLLRRIITIVCIVASFIANAGEQFRTNAKCAVNQPTKTELQLIQGTWEGVLVGDNAHQKITITITGNSLHFHRDTNFWFETVFTLPAAKDPKQLHATIKGCPPSQASSIGKVVRTFFKIEDATLTLATIDDDAEETQKSFEAAGTRYELRKIQPQRRIPNYPKPNEPETPDHQLPDHQLSRLLPLLLPFCCGFVAGLTSTPARIYRYVADVAAQEGGRGVT